MQKKGKKAEVLEHCFQQRQNGGKTHKPRVRSRDVTGGGDGAVTIAE